MSALDRVLPTPGLVEIDTIDLALPPAAAWELLRHGDLAGGSRAIRLLFALRTLPDRLAGKNEPVSLRLDDLSSSTERPGFQILYETTDTLVVGAIGQVWKPEIPFVHVESADAFAVFDQPGFVKVAWSLVVAPLGKQDSRVTLEVRVDATDEDAWKKFRAYFALIGPASRFIRRSLFAGLAREHGTPESKENVRALPGDELLPDANAQATDAITIAATPEAIWPWLVQMGCRRGGFYAYDALDNGGARSVREIHPELQTLAVGDDVPATPDGSATFEVLALHPARVLVLGGLYDAAAEKQRRFRDPRPERFWHATWSFVLEPLDAKTTRVHVRGRVAFPRSERLHAGWIRLVHHVMERAQLAHLAARAEGRLPADDWRDVAEGIGGAAIMAACLLTPFARNARSHWGLDEATANRVHPGDELVETPRWSWTHGIEIDAPPEEVWPWVAQIGADRGGFYSYQWLENLAGCALRNAERVHPEWEACSGDELRLHPKMPPLDVVSVGRGRSIVAHASSTGKSWANVSWLFFVEPLPGGRSRFVSRYRCACSDDLTTRLSLGPTLIEPIGFAMDRKMLLGVKERVERARGIGGRHG